MKSQTLVVEKIKNYYVQEEVSDFDKLKALDKKVKRPAKVFGYVHGSISSLILGVGMCMAMKIIGGGMIFGVVVGLVGIALTSATYAMYKKILKTRKERYASEIIALTDDLLKN